MLKDHLQAEWKVGPTVHSQRGTTSAEIMTWETDQKRITLLLIGVLTKPRLTLHYQSNEPARANTSRPPAARGMPQPRLSEHTTASTRQGDADARLQMAIFCLSQGRQNTEEANRWLRKAADQGDPQAQFNMGDCHRRGMGVKAGMAEALQWHQKAAAADYPPASHMLLELDRR